MFGILSMATADYARKWSFCLESQLLYAAQQGYEYRLHSASAPGLNAKWSKFRYTIEMLLTHGGVMLIDADAEIAPTAPPADALLAERPGIDMLYVNGISGRLNSGVLVMRGGAESAAVAILRHCLDNRDMPVPREDFVTAEGENGHLIHAIKQDRFAGRVATLERNWNCTVPEGIGSAHVRHYTNKLRQALDRGRVRPLEDLSRPKRGLLRKLVRVG